LQKRRVYKLVFFAFKQNSIPKKEKRRGKNLCGKATNFIKNSIFCLFLAINVLGELLFSNGEIEEAKKNLSNVINTPYENDVADYEKSVAYGILNQIE
jgi:hypothetical protein